MKKSMKVHFIAVSRNAETGPRSAARSLTSSSEIVSAPIDTLLDASNDPDVPANGYVTEIEYPKRGKTIKNTWVAAALLRNARPDRYRPGLGAHNHDAPAEPGADSVFPGKKDHLTRSNRERQGHHGV